MVDAMAHTKSSAAAAAPRWNKGRWLIWSAYALVLIIAPLIWSSSLSLTMLSQMGIAIIACLAYNVLLGQGGMLSFGHAVYSGLGSFFAMHALNMISAGQLRNSWCSYFSRSIVSGRRLAARKAQASASWCPSD